MDEVPWVAMEFARLCLGKNVAGLRSIEMVWSMYSNVPTPNGTPLGPDFIVGNRKSILDQLTNWIGNEILGSTDDCELQPPPIQKPWISWLPDSD